MIIDVHGHITSPELFKRFPMPKSLADVDGMIEQKLALGIELTIVGSPAGAGTMVPVPGLDNYAQPPEQLDAFHEWAAETVRSHPQHLRAYVYLNPFDPASLPRAARWLAEPEFVGLIVNTSVRGQYLGDPAAADFFAMAAENRAPVLLHPPAQPVGHEAMAGNLGLIEHVCRPCDITGGLASILFAGVLDRHPELMLIAPNAGGALSLLAEKLDLAQQRAGGPPGAGSPSPAPATPLSQSLSRIYVDTATPSSVALAGAVEVFGPSQLLFGTDTPPLTGSLARAVELVRSLPVSDGEQAGILGNNAARLFGLAGVGVS